jgi:DNA-binding NarL/FixJ family response regulator
VAKQQKIGKKIRIMVSDGTAMATSLLVQALSREPGIEVLPPVSPGHLGTAITANQPEVVVLSMNMAENPCGGCEIVRELRVANPHVRFILLLDNRKREAILQAFQAGARGVFCRAESVQLLVRCIEAVSNGQVWANSSEIGYALEALIQLSATQVTRPKVQELFTARELEVLRCVAQGLSNREIADRLRLSEHTVKNYLFRMFDKLGVSSRVELLLCSLAQSPAQLPGGGSLLRESPAVALECWTDLAQPFIASHCAMRDARHTEFSDPQDRIAAFAWTAMMQRICESMSADAKAAEESLLSRLTEAERGEAVRRADTWLKNYWDRFDKNPPPKNAAIKANSDLPSSGERSGPQPHRPGGGWPSCARKAQAY